MTDYKENIENIPTFTLNLLKSGLVLAFGQHFDSLPSFFLGWLHAGNIFTLQMTDYKENFKKISTFLLPKLPCKGQPFSGILTAIHHFSLVFSVWVPPGNILTLQTTDYKEKKIKISTFYLNFLPKASLFQAF